jgi:WD40 repeat protein
MNREKKLYSISNIFVCSILILSILPLTGNTVKAVDVTKFSNIRTLTGHKDEVTAISWSPDGKFIATGARDNTTIIWDAATGKSLRILTEHDRSISALAWNPNGSRLAAGACDNRFKIYDTTNWSVLLTVDVHMDCTRYIIWNKAGTQVTTQYKHNQTAIWDATSGKLLRSLYMMPLAWSPDGTLMANRYYNNITGEAVRISYVSNDTLVGVVGGGYRASWSPDGGSIAIYDYQLSIWNTTNFTMVKEIPLRNIESFAWSPDSSKIATLDEDDVVKIWDVKTAEVLITIQATLYYHWSSLIQWSPDGTRIATTGDYNMTRIWGEPKPHVFLSSIFVDKSRIIAGDTVNVTAYVVNDGTEAGYDLEMKLYDGIVLVSAKSVTVAKDSTLKVVFPWKTDQTTSMDAHILRVFLEKDQLSRSVLVTGWVEPYIQSMSVDRIVAEIGDNVTVSVIVANNGTADATNLEVRFYDDAQRIESKVITVPKGNTTAVQFIWNTRTVHPGTHVLKAAVYEKSMTRTVEVQQETVVLKADITNYLVLLIVIILVLISAGCGYLVARQNKTKK